MLNEIRRSFNIRLKKTSKKFAKTMLINGRKIAKTLTWLHEQLNHLLSIVRYEPKNLLSCNWPFMSLKYITYVPKKPVLHWVHTCVLYLTSTYGFVIFTSSLATGMFNGFKWKQMCKKSALMRTSWNADTGTAFKSSKHMETPFEARWEQLRWT